MKRTRHLLATLLVPFLFLSCPRESGPRVWEGSVTLPTNDEFMQNPVPQVAGAEKGNIYPYALHKFIDYRLMNRTFRAVFLENEYLIITILPELGGHVYSALDKKSGNEIFWANPELKKALIGVTGAWSAFGLEFNFPIRGHLPTSLMPVDVFALKRDGRRSASVVLGDREYLGDMRWTAEVVLRAKSPRLEIRMRLANPTALPRPLYYWCNAAIPAGDSLQVVYPQPRSSTHNSPWIRPWPVEEGRDLSWYRNHVGYMYSRFNRDDTENFMGYYDFSRKFGAYHFADRDVLPFRKFWSWGLSPVGRNWNKRLSDTGGDYIEIQAGLFKDQETMGFLLPHESLEFTEYWIPVRKCGGFSTGNLDAALGLRIDSTSIVGRHRISFGYNVLDDFGRGTLELRRGKQILSSHKVDLKAGSSEEFICLEPISREPYTVVLSDKSGGRILSFVQDGYGATEEFKPGPLAYPGSLDNPGSAEDWHQSALKQELLYDYAGAADLLAQGLSRFPNSCLLNKSQARLMLTTGRPEKALPLLHSSQHRHYHDPELDYLKALALFETGNLEQAAHCFSLSLRLSFAPASCCYHLGLCKAGRGLFAEAARHFRDALRFSPPDSLAAFAAAWADRKAQNKEGIDTLALFRPRREFKQWQYAVADLCALREFKAASRYLDACGDFNDHPMFHYTKAYLLWEEGSDPLPELALGRACGVEHVMPHTGFDRKVLEFASQQDPRDPSAAYLLGLLYLAALRTDEAAAKLTQAVSLEGHSPLCEVALYLACRKQNRPLEEQEKTLRDALALNPGLQFAALELNRLLVKNGVPAGERLRMLQAAETAAGALCSEELSRDIILTRLETGDIEGAAAGIRLREYHTWEGGHGMRPVWWNAHLSWTRRLMREKRFEEALQKLDLSLGFPANIFAQESDFGLEGYETLYWKGRLLKSLSRGEEAEKAFRESAQWQPYAAGNRGGGDAEKELTYHALFAALSLRELEEEDNAGAALSEYASAMEKGGLDPLAETLYLHITGSRKAARQKAEEALKQEPFGMKRLLLMEYLAGNYLP